MLRGRSPSGAELFGGAGAFSPQLVAESGRHGCPRAGQLTGSWCLCAHSEATVPTHTDFLTGTHFTRQDGRTPTSPNSPRCLPKTTVGPGPALWANALLRGPREGPGEQTSSTCVLGAWTPLKHRVLLRWPRIPWGSLVTGGSRGQRSPSPRALPSVSYTMGCMGFGAAFGLVRGPLPRPGTEDGLLPQHVQVQPCGWIWADQAGGAVTTDVLRPAGDPGPRGEQRPRVLGRPSSSCLSPGRAPAGGGCASRARPVNVRAEPMEETPPLSRGHSQRSLCLR